MGFLGCQPTGVDMGRRGSGVVLTLSKWAFTSVRGGVPTGKLELDNEYGILSGVKLPVLLTRKVDRGSTFR